jgi:hypothetical protein
MYYLCVCLLQQLYVRHTQCRNFWHIWKSRSEQSLFRTRCLKCRTNVLHFNSICTMFVLACYKGSICAPHTYRNFSHIWKSRSKKSLLPTSSLQRKTKVLHFNSICTMFVFACYPSSICDKVWESLAWGGTFPWTGVSDLSHIISHIECVYHLFYHSYSLCVCAFVYDIPCVLLIQHGLLCLMHLGVL